MGQIIDMNRIKQFLIQVFEEEGERKMTVTDLRRVIVLAGVLPMATYFTIWTAIGQLPNKHQTWFIFLPSIVIICTAKIVNHIAVKIIRKKSI